MTAPLTIGTHHIGLTVSDLEASAQFFTSLLGWKEVKHREDYPAIYVSDGKLMVTLWAVKESPANVFDRRKNVGLHHLALQVASAADLDKVHQTLVNHGTAIEFAPETLGPGPAKHMMCTDPSGIRIEFIWLGN